MPIRTRDFDAIKSIHLCQANLGLNQFDLFGDHIKAFVKIERVTRMKIGGRFEIIHAFPPIHHCELGPFGRQNWGKWCGFCRSPCRAVFMREMKAKFVLIILNRF